MTSQSIRLLLVAASTSSLLALAGCDNEVAEAPNESCETSADCLGDLICSDNQCIPETDTGNDPFCGDGTLDELEACDTGIPAGEPGACPTECPPRNACTPGKLFGEACDAECGFDTSITDPIDDDGCCPLGADPSTDNDCMETCGNGELDDGEICDDGLENGQPLKCAHDCQGITASVCGNEVLEEGEDCDEGTESATCNADCSAASCGDGVWNYTAGEECDDGELTATCTEQCTVSTCGDRIVNALAGETCDDGAENGDPLKCNDTCDGITTAVCGNGIQEAGETCDDGTDNGQPNQCNLTCDGITAAICGNGVQEAGETCDDGAENGDPLKCNTTCDGITAAVCGNGVQEPGEDCDDAGFSATCNSNCTATVCGDGIVNTAAGETCDDAGDNGQPLKCNATCNGTTAAVCGNNILEAGETCDEGPDNGQPLKCNNSCDGITAAVCGNGIQEAGETCDDGVENGDPLKCNATCNGITAAVCGNGIQEAGEVCDDGAQNGQPNMCNSSCSGTADAVCGNGVIESGETCDDGPENGDPLKCNTTCNGISAPVCGNSVQEPGEACDDGGFSATCNNDCTPAACGDGITNPAAGETCDDAGDNGQPNKCNSTCTGTTAAVCGNSIVETGETCDDGSDNGQPNKCNSTCTGTTAAVCGNGIQEAGEACDDGAQNGQPNQCNSTCTGTTAATCGNGVIETGETCDDGAQNGNPLQCNSTCNGTTASVCGNNVIEAGETCDDGAQNGQPNQCNNSCNGTTAPVCGNSVVEANEDCDDGGESATCNSDCSAAVCGDGVLNTTAGEECDEGQATATCAADCTIPTAFPSAYRIDTARIIDPHLFVVPLFGCSDVTNSGVAGQLPGGVNGMLTEAFTESAEPPNDNLFNMSIAILMRPLTQGANLTFDVDIAFPDCENPLGGCTANPNQPNVMSQATNVATAACLPPSQQPGRRSTYTGLNNPTGNCFVSMPTSVTLSIGDIQLSLVDAKIVGKYLGNPATEITEGVLMGFLPKSVADNTTIDVPVLGQRTISSFLRGGGGCGTNANNTDIDSHNGEPGWWFYLNYTGKLASSWTE